MTRYQRPDPEIDEILRPSGWESVDLDHTGDTAPCACEVTHDVDHHLHRRPFDLIQLFRQAFTQPAIRPRSRPAMPLQRHCAPPYQRGATQLLRCRLGSRRAPVGCALLPTPRRFPLGDIIRTCSRTPKFRHRSRGRHLVSHLCRSTLTSNCQLEVKRAGPELRSPLNDAI
ncbi:hypothetical protein ACPA9J_11135 [Pseudomonas aeruginosa]